LDDIELFFRGISASAAAAARLAVCIAGHPLMEALFTLEERCAWEWETPMGITFPWESYGNGNIIYFTRVKIPKIIMMH